MCYHIIDYCNSHM